MTRTEQAYVKRLKKRIRDLYTGYCVIKTWLSMPKDEEDTIYHIASLCTEKILNEKNEYLVRLTKFVRICLSSDIRMIFENPITGSFLNNYFLKPPTLKDNNRMLRGDYYVKPTGYWFWNCEPTCCHSIQNDKDQKLFQQAESRWTQKAGTCSEERSMISPDYARNFIADFILGKPLGGRPQQQDLFTTEG